jgi:Flp pilus assembly protein TadB
MNKEKEEEQNRTSNKEEAGQTMVKIRRVDVRGQRNQRRQETRSINKVFPKPQLDDERARDDHAHLLFGVLVRGADWRVVIGVVIIAVVIVIVIVIVFIFRRKRRVRLG